MVQKIAQELIREAVAKGVSDLYLLPREASYQVYERVLDTRSLIGEFDESTYAAIISHFKFVAGMNVGEKRRSQQGACDYDYKVGTIALRLSTVGDYRGKESLVIRFLYDQQEELHFWFDALDRVQDTIRGRGLYLFSGPVGSGKTTLMYHLAEMKFAEQQIVTIEDPVEIKRDAMLQLQLNETIGLTYDSLIKLSLRHRPDLLIIGEIRDKETARAVIRASLTGITIFSTVHGKSISGVYARMLELGVSSDELHHALQGIIYQRLIGGGGIVDVATEAYQTYSATQWNQQIDRLFTAGHISVRQAQAEKIIFDSSA
ncbi:MULTISPECIES: competence type IV pilus ATPase ComGA [unclassified Streptococcus]|uniref:competence type IV pilus ATPase ComGA n=1 Tax=unclassified Streptococcus TaxID=2608887 RepID=UPI001072EADF|nr:MULTISPECIES: competence type IV pilus ATPase ComGA [unclassified Streptococcus]MBF0786738.1 Flp pilus assembly complex ATPase component TadA [Streptococcus sp. 19428wC2_LYSM12]MCQ9211606.1 Flp pilus assembly complex ATPase component TadA [Streptococcus sp. B01]MCQ9213202.1 Flp pilus assembly complex ATPase component TadA [Streptococcus sp. O1]MCQ9214919.1 Flp pilus assembly complex ATPase component TadA [Streptococcus sp. O1]TFV06486.1 type II/IV secretion system protein [Streptococcus sp.